MALSGSKRSDQSRTDALRKSNALCNTTAHDAENGYPVYIMDHYTAMR